MMKSEKEEEGKKVHKNLVPSALKRGVSLRSTHEATYRGSVEDTGYRIDYNSERLGVSHIIGQKSRLSGVAPPRPKGNPFEEAEDEEDDLDDLDDPDDLEEMIAGLTGNMNSGISHPGGPGARGGMVGGGRGRGVPGRMAVSGRNSLSPQIPNSMYNPMTRPVPQVYQQQGGAQRFPQGPPNAPFGGVGSARPQQMGGGMFAPGRGTAIQNPRRSSVPMPGPGRGGIGNTPLYNSSLGRLPLPLPPRPLTQTALPASTVASQGYNNSTYRQQKTLEILMQHQEEDNRKRDAMRDQGLQSPTPVYSNVSSREGSLLDEPSSNSSGLSLPYATTPTFQGSDRRSSTSSGITLPSMYSRKGREEVLQRQQEEEEIFQRRREEGERPERLAQDSGPPQHLRGLPTSPATPGSPGATRAAFPPGHAENQPGTARSEAILPELEIAPAGTTTTHSRRPSDPPDRPGTATTVVSLPELGSRADPGTPPRRRPSSQSWSGPDRTDSLGIDRVAARRKPLPKPRESPDTPPTSPPPVSKISTNGTGKKSLRYTGPVGPWFPTLPTPIDSAKSSPLSPPTELPGLTATKPNTYCISDDIARRPSVARGYRFNEEHEVQCLSDDIQNGSLLAGEKGILPPEFFDRHQTACISDDLAEVCLGLGEEGEQELRSQMEHEQRLREAIKERACLGDELSEWHIDRSGPIPVIEEEGEAPTHAQPYTAEIPMMAEEADARRHSKLFNNPGHLGRKPPPPPKPPKVPVAPPKIPESPPPPPEDEVPPPQARWEMSWEYY